jgi:hypothetical protein
MTEIIHSPGETMPRPGKSYRCHVCRLELVADERSNKMTVAPLDPSTSREDANDASDK